MRYIPRASYTSKHTSYSRAFKHLKVLITLTHSCLSISFFVFFLSLLFQVLRKAGRVDDHPEEASASTSDHTFTRSKSTPFDKTVCFFCEEKFTKRNSGIPLRTDEAGRNLHAAIKKSNNEKWSVKLSTAIDPNDAHAIDVLNHRKCYLTNVTNVFSRRGTPRWRNYSYVKPTFSLRKYSYS